MTPAVAVALAAASATPFAPPLDHPLRYEIVESAPAAQGGTNRFAIVEEASFARDGAGYALTLRVLSFAAISGAAAARADAEAAVRPTIGVPLVLRLAGDGAAVSVIDGDRNWAAVIAGMRAAVARPGVPAGRRAAAEAMAALPRTARDAQLLEAADDIVPRQREGGPHRLDARDRPQPGGAVLRVQEALDVSPESGLVLHRLRSRSVLPAGGAAPFALGTSEARLVGF